uniref:Uncharacterized protein n=1 Tax=Plectus sambesii TaxID=2011161 RepID=A0A914VYI6_9BILA
MDICHPRPLLQKLSSNSKQYLYLAESLEQRYKSKAESAVGNKEQDGEYCQFASMVLCEHEGQVKKGLLDLIDSYECCVNDSTAYCTTNFNYARYEFTMLFDIWTAIRKIYDVVKHASVWDPAPRTSNDSQTNLEAVKNTIDVTLLQFICNGQLPLFKNAIEQILSCCSSQFGEEHQYYTIPPDSHIDPQAQNIAEQLDYLLDFFHDSVHRSKEGTLSVWRREAKKAMTGVGLTKNITEKELSETRPAMALRNATNDSLVVDWRYRKLCQPHIVIRSKSRENVSIIVKILAAVESFQMTEFSEQFPSLINFRQSTITAKFIKPVNNDVALQEEIAIQLRDNVICNREYYIDRAGSITHINDAKKGELIANATMDPVDKTVGAQFDDVTFVLETGRRKLSKLERVARTKYHIDVTAKVVVNSAMTFRMGGLRTELKTLSTPFCCSVNNGQDQALYKDFLWNLLGASPDSVSCHCLPMTSTETDSSLVYWGDYREALKWLFLKLTYSRALHDDELNYLGRTLLGTNDLSASATISYQHGEPGKLGFSRIREEKTNKLASFFNWYFEAIELIMDRSDKSDRLWTEEQPKNHSTLTMGKLFESG